MFFAFVLKFSAEPYLGSLVWRMPFSAASVVKNADIISDFAVAVFKNM
ncbi:hypothetical protein l11_19210 [Neisseria weaveri LMG 5135]|nr:hypothetical protein l11_19210 [Neisseria weaveri LMG 5135]